MQVVAFGRPTVYPARGELQFTVVRLDAEGDGLRRKALEKTRQRLEADGLLAPERKRALPRFPRVIAVITSPDGAALHDIVAVVRRRRAAGASRRRARGGAGRFGARRAVRRTRRVSNRWRGADLVIVSRGGGAKRRSLGLQRRKRRARRRRVSGADDFRGGTRGRSVHLRPRRRLSRADAVGRRRSGDALQDRAGGGAACVPRTACARRLAAKFSADRDHLRHAARDLVSAAARADQHSSRRARASLRTASRAESPGDDGSWICRRARQRTATR